MLSRRIDCFVAILLVVDDEAEGGYTELSSSAVMVPLNELYLGKECKTGFFSYLNYNEKMYGCVVF